MKQTFLITVLAILTILMLASLAIAQTGTSKTMTFTAEDGEITLLPGINAIVRDKDGQLTIEMVPPKNQRDKAYQDVDLEVNDILFMCNGKAIKSITELNDIIKEIKIGEEIGFAIKRGKDRLIASLVKADPEAGGKMMVMTQTIGGEESAKDELAISSGGQMLNDVTFLSCGIVIKDVDGQPSVVAALPGFPADKEGQKPIDGDVLVSINGTKAKTSQEVSDIFDKVKIGENVTFVFKHDNKTFEITVTKEEQPEGNIIIKKG